jgi:2-polyprenyl-3-methyl-5-hydroxy-6-metoxy-1,4-benzoquinol methylase
LDHLKEKYKILIVGCGISRTAEELWDEGFKDVSSIDFSYTAIKF